MSALLYHPSILRGYQMCIRDRFWLANYNTFPSLDLLLCALGGAVK